MKLVLTLLMNGATRPSQLWQKVTAKSHVKVSVPVTIACMAIRERVRRSSAKCRARRSFPRRAPRCSSISSGAKRHRATRRCGVTRTLLGGRGANMYYLYRLLDETLSPLDPDIPLIFGSGLLTGLVPSAARGNCTSWSPESGVLLDSNAGDYFPSFIRMNGFDHIVLYGKAPAWTVLIIREGVVTFEDGTPYAGMDNIDMREAIARDIGGTWARNLAMVNITRAGENGVLTSGIMAGPKAIYARGGPGAKMGSLGLKAHRHASRRRTSSRPRSRTSRTTASSRRSCSRRRS